MMTLMLRKRTKLYVNLVMVFLTTFITMGQVYAGGGITLASPDMAVGTSISSNSATAPTGYTVTSVASNNPSIATVSGINGLGSLTATFTVNGVAANQSSAEIKAVFTPDVPGEDPDSASAFETVVKVVSIAHKNLKNKTIGDSLTKKDFKIKTFPTGYQNRKYVMLNPDPLTIVIGLNQYKAECGTSEVEGEFRAAEVTITKNWLLSEANDTLESSFLINGADGTWEIHKSGSDGSDVRTGPLSDGVTHYENNVIHTHEFASVSKNNNNISNDFPLSYGLASIPKNWGIPNCGVIIDDILLIILGVTLSVGVDIVKGQLQKKAKWNRRGFETTPNFHNYTLRPVKNPQFWAPKILQGNSSSLAGKLAYACFADDQYSHSINATHQVTTVCEEEFVTYDDHINEPFPRDIIRSAYAGSTSPHVISKNKSDAVSSFSKQYSQVILGNGKGGLAVDTNIKWTSDSKPHIFQLK